MPVTIEVNPKRPESQGAVLPFGRITPERLREIGNELELAASAGPKEKGGSIQVSGSRLRRLARELKGAR